MKLSEEELAVRRDILCDKYALIKEFAFNFGVPESYREDLMQEIFVAAYTNIHNLNDMASLDAWLYRISYRKMIHFARAHKNRLEKETAYPEYYGETGMEDEEIRAAGDRMNHYLTDEELCGMIMSLKPPAPYIIKLRFERGATLKEISVLLHLKYNTVKTIENRALKKLRTMIEERDGADDGEKT